MFSERLMNLMDVGTDSLVEWGMANPPILELVGESPDQSDALHLNLDRAGPEFQGRDLDDPSRFHVKEPYHLGRTVTATEHTFEPGGKSHVTSCSAPSFFFN